MNISFSQSLTEHLTLIGQKFNSCHAAGSGQFCSTGAGGSGLGIAHEAKVIEGIQKVQAYGLETGDEAAVAYNNQGEQINGMVTGGESSVDDTQLIAYGNVYASIHNHPGDCGGSFSGEDINSFVRFHQQHMIVVTDDGTLYKLSRPEGWRPKGDKDYRKVWQKTKDSPIAAKYQRRLRAGENSNVVWKDYTHEITTKIASDMGLEYTRVLPGE